MACLACGQSVTEYELVEHVSPTENRERVIAAEVCTPCAEEFLLADPNAPDCAFCDDTGEYDLVEADGTRPEDRDLAAERVVCEEHLRDLESDERGR